MPPGAQLTPQEFADVQTLWDYHHLNHEPRPTDVGIGLGSHDIGVAAHTADLYHQGMFPLIVFTGANAPTTIDRFPRGEAIHYRDHALSLGVPEDAILIETNARSTVDNITYARGLLTEHDVSVASVTIVSRPYQQRRTYNIARKLWPAVDVVCGVQEIELREYLHCMGATDLIANTIVADTQRLASFMGLETSQLPTAISAAYQSLVLAGYDRRVEKARP